MAPEQAVADRRLTGAADVFALGSLLLYAANGRPPFGDGSGPDLLYRVVHGEPDFGRLTDGDPALAELVRKCLAKDPADRPTAEELVALTEEGRRAPSGPRPWPGGSPSGPPSRPGRPPPSSSRSWSGRTRRRTWRRPR
ncbi:protein kinase [Streptomyces diastatochromogenes]|nr:protein kinase [Streptomyces diastatochromogenes]